MPDLAPESRVHPKTVVFTWGAREKQELPFVIGVMADLAGKSQIDIGAPGSRQFASIEDKDDQRLEDHMKALLPRVAFTIPNRLNSEEGEIQVDIEFESMDDFTPAAVAKKIGALSKLLDTRERLALLVGCLGGKTDAQSLLEDLLKKVRALR